jgi:hypothetical protein
LTGRESPAGHRLRVSCQALPGCRIETKDGFGSPGELIVFELDAEGRVRQVRIGENYAYPVTEW